MDGPLPYLTQNSFRAYPLKDGQSLRLTTGEYFPENFLLDALIVLDIDTPNIGDVALKRITLTEFAGNLNMEIVLRLYDSITSAVIADETLTPIIPPPSIQNQATIATVYLGLQLKLSIGERFVEDAQQVLSTTVPVVYDFPDVDTNLVSSFADSVCILPPPKVTSITFENADSVDGPYTEVAVKETPADTEVVIGAGTNMLYEGTDKMEVSVIPGEGAGLYDPCSGIIDGILSLQQVDPDDDGNFTFRVDDCYTARKILPGSYPILVDDVLEYRAVNNTAGLFIVNRCKPKCGPEEIQSLGFYINRIKAGLLGLVTPFTQLYNVLVSGYGGDVVNMASVGDITTVSSNAPEVLNLTSGSVVVISGTDYDGEYTVTSVNRDNNTFNIPLADVTGDVVGTWTAQGWMNDYADNIQPSRVIPSLGADVYRTDASDLPFEVNEQVVFITVNLTVRNPTDKTISIQLRVTGLDQVGIGGTEVAYQQRTLTTVYAGNVSYIEPTGSAGQFEDSTLVVEANIPKGADLDNPEASSRFAIACKRSMLVSFGALKDIELEESRLITISGNYLLSSEVSASPFDPITIEV